MIFEENKFVIKLGEKIGFLFSYCLFTTILFFVLSFSGHGLVFWKVAIITFIITLIGLIIKRVLK